MAKLKRYLAYDYNKIDFKIKINILIMLISNNEDLENDSTITSITTLITKSSKIIDLYR